MAFAAATRPTELARQCGQQPTNRNLSHVAPCPWLCRQKQAFRYCARKTVAVASAQRSKVAANAAVVTEPPATFTEEVMVDIVPSSLLRKTEDGDSMRARFERVIRESQDSICAAIEEVDGTKFHQDAWTRPAGGGGITRVMQGGKVWEKAGVNVSVVYGSMPAAQYRARGDLPIPEDNARVPFFAAGISCVMHPWNPKAPTMHFNYRYFETDPWNGVDSQWWFGGGTDITPAYLYEDDMKHFHGTLKGACDKHDPEYYPKFKKWADDYFVIPHRGETRGLGGIFFDDLNDRSKEQIFAFSEDCQKAVVPAYVPLVVRRKDETYTEQEKEWQQLRRGRYVEFNLVYDRGTIFGLKTGAGRTESMLMSLPLTCRYEYDHAPHPGSAEADILDAFQNPREWL